MLGLLLSTALQHTSTISAKEAVFTQYIFLSGCLSERNIKIMNVSSQNWIDKQVLGQSFRCCWQYESGIYAIG